MSVKRMFVCQSWLILLQIAIFLSATSLRSLVDWVPRLERYTILNSDYCVGTLDHCNNITKSGPLTFLYFHFPSPLGVEDWCNGQQRQHQDSQHCPRHTQVCCINISNIKAVNNTVLVTLRYVVSTSATSRWSTLSSGMLYQQKQHQYI